MVSERQHAIEEWYDRAADHDRVPRPWHMQVPRRAGLELGSRTLNTVKGFETVAEMIRDDRGSKPPIVRVPLPNLLTARRYHQVTEVVHRKGGIVLSMPQAVLDRTEVQVHSIEMIETVRGRGRRADTHLFRGEVQAWEYDSRYRPRLEKRTAYFLTGYDANERGLAYFFCELPPDAKPESMREAYLSLRPGSVEIAEQSGREVKRQGDMFFVRMDKGFDPDGMVLERRFLHGSNHLATEAVLKQSLTFVRGRIVHAPSGRRPDHHSLTLGRHYWWLCVRNTVPLVK